MMVAVGSATTEMRDALWQIEQDNLPCHVRDPNKVLEPYLKKHGASISVLADRPSLEVEINRSGSTCS
jgi:hypothetical protein